MVPRRAGVGGKEHGKARGQAPSAPDRAEAERRNGGLPPFAGGARGPSRANKPIPAQGMDHHQQRRDAPRRVHQGPAMTGSRHQLNPSHVPRFN